MDLSQQRPTERFSALADCYQRFRPSYPDAAIDFIMERCASRSIVAAGGRGRGHGDRLAAVRGAGRACPGCRAQRRDAAAGRGCCLSAGQPVPRYREGTGEATGLPDAVATAVLSAQAFHWCKPELALLEFVHILKPGGWVALMWYERDETDAFTAAYGDLLRALPDTAAMEGSRTAPARRCCRALSSKTRRTMSSPANRPWTRKAFWGERSRCRMFRARASGPNSSAGSCAALFRRFELQGQVALHYENIGLPGPPPLSP